MAEEDLNSLCLNSIQVNAVAPLSLDYFEMHGIHAQQGRASKRGEQIDKRTGKEKRQI